MVTVFDKLNLKLQRQILIADAPASFEPQIDLLTQSMADLVVHRDVQASGPMSAVNFALAFVKTQAELDRVSAGLVQRAQGDAVLWFAYPKQSSKRYRCDFNRDSGWTVLRAAGFDSVRMVAIDEDWSALRFRRVEFIKAPAKGGA